VARGLKRSSEGIADESLDEPLHHDVQKSLEREFTKYYKFGLKAANMGCDTLLGRFSREFNRGTLTVFPLHRVRSLAHVSKDQPKKKRRLGPDVVMEFEQEESHDDLKDMSSIN
jgi:hypothetical protein